MDFKYNPKISVIIPLYNHEKYIREAVYSALDQTFSDLELIVINDGSQDNSEAIVKGIKDDRIKYIYQENQGAHNAINRGIRIARGEYISILNSDDIYYKNRLEECLKILETDRSVFAVFSDMEIIDPEGNSSGFTRGAEDNWKNHNPASSFKGENSIFLDLLAGNFLMTSSNLFCRKGIFDKIGYFSNFRYVHDYDFFLRLCYHYNAYFIGTPLLKYRIHDSNTIRENEAVVSFEVGLMFTHFFSQYDMGEVFKGRNIKYNDKYSDMVKFFNSLNTYKTDRMMLTLLLFGMKDREGSNELFKPMTEDLVNPFRKVCIDSFQTYIDSWKDSQRVWQDSQEAWRKWEETNQRLIETELKLNDEYEKTKEWWQNSQEAWRKWEETNQRLVETVLKLNEAGEKTKEWWLNSQEAWKEVEDISKKLMETEQALSKTEEKLSWTTERLTETERKVQEKTQHINILLNSRSYLLGRALTWPVRKLLGKK
ncbi:MAG: glycosyltransferase [Nitrospirae bacterium]|nr:glycosyltransferase [Nitrospirota bacterium]